MTLKIGGLDATNLQLQELRNDLGVPTKSIVNNKKAKLKQLCSNYNGVLERVATTPRATITTGASAPTAGELTGLTKYMGNFGAGSSFSGAITIGSDTITGVTSINALTQVGCYIFAVRFNGSPIPTEFPIGTRITEIGSNYIKVDKKALSTISSQEFRVTDPRVVVEGCVPYSAHGYIQWGNTMTATNISTISPSLEFITESDVVLIDFNFNGDTTGSNAANIRITVDDVFENIQNQIVGGNRWVKLTFSDSQLRKITIDINDIYGNKRLEGLYLKSTAKCVPTPAKLAKIMIVADSWGQSGAGALYGVHQNAGARLSKALKASYVLGGIDGSGYSSGHQFNLDNRALMCGLIDFDAIIFHGSLNDSGKTLGSTPIEAWSKHRAQSPNTPIFVFGVFPWQQNGTEVAAAALENQLISQFALWNDPNSYFIPIATARTPWIDSSNRAGLFADGAHLNHAGTRLMAQMMTQAICEIVSKWDIIQ